MAQFCDRLGSAFLALSLASTGAGTGCAPGRARPPEIPAHPWLATIIDGQPADPDVRSTLQIEGSRIFGSAGCNRYSGRLMPEDQKPDVERVRIAQVAATRMACPPPRSEQEERFFGAFGRVEGLRIETGRLLLLGRNGTPLIILVPADRN
ncbi:MAG: META domain-containing protein [Alphaproteobacteria bacterium]